MKDCSSCPFSVENHPEYKHKKWKELPCATCEAKEPFGKTLSYNDQVLYDDTIDLSDQDHRNSFIGMTAYMFRCWIQLDDLERDIIVERILRPEMSNTEIAKTYSISRQALYKAYRRIGAKFPVLETLTPYKGGKNE